MSAGSSSGGAIHSAGATPRSHAVAASPAASSASAAPPPPAAAPAGGGGGAALAAYDALLSTTLAGVVRNAAAVGGDVAKVTAHVQGAYEKQRSLLAVAERAKQPSNSELQALLQPVANEMVAAGKLADDRRSAAFQQLKVVAEALNGLSWLAYTGPACGARRFGGGTGGSVVAGRRAAGPGQLLACGHLPVARFVACWAMTLPLPLLDPAGMPAPPQNIADAWNAAEFYANKLMMALRGKDETQMAWLKGIKARGARVGGAAGGAGACPGCS
jgi:hypothetical protein